MSLHSNIDHLAATPGIVAVLVDPGSGATSFRGQESWAPVLQSAVAMLGGTREPTIRVVLAEHTLVVQAEGGETVGVVLPTGHAVAKSLRRMIRRMAKKERRSAVRHAAVQSASATPPHA